MEIGSVGDDRLRVLAELLMTLLTPVTGDILDDAQLVISLVEELMAVEVHSVLLDPQPIDFQWSDSFGWEGNKGKGK